MCEQFKSSVFFLAKSGSVSRVLSSGRARGGKMKPKVWTDSGNGLHAALNKLDVILLTFGAMLGWGWVILTGEWILSAGAFGAAAAFVLGGIFVSFVSLVYAELSSAMPNSLGVIGFCRRAFGTRISFLCGWAVILTFLSVISFETVAFPNVFAYLFPDILSGYLYSAAGFEIHAPWLLIGVGSSLLICAVNYRGVRTAALLQTVLMAVILLAGILLAGGTVVNGKPENLFPLFSNGPHGVLTVVVMTPFIYSGFDVIPHAAEEMNIPPRKIGQLLVLSVGLAVIWYVSIILCVSCTLSRQQIASSALPTADAMAAAFGGNTAASRLLVAGGVAGIVTCWNAFYIGASRTVYAMSREGLLPAWFGKIHPKYRTPSRAILLIMVLTSAAPFFGATVLKWAANAGSFATVVTYLLVSVSYLRLRRREPDMPRPYSAARWRLAGGGSLLLSAVMLAAYLPGSPASLSWPYEWVIVGGWAVLGLLFYRSSPRRKASRPR